MAPYELYKIQFLGEYRNQVGENIPYRNFGYGDLQEFLNDAKNVCKVNYGPDGTAVVRGVGSEETAHIQVIILSLKTMGPWWIIFARLESFIYKFQLFFNDRYRISGFGQETEADQKAKAETSAPAS